jgi:hypothetical protein
VKTRARLRCHGLFGEWTGTTWRCVRCHRDLRADAPATAADTTLAFGEALAAKLRPWTPAEEELARTCFPFVTTNAKEHQP